MGTTASAGDIMIPELVVVPCISIKNRHSPGFLTFCRRGVETTRDFDSQYLQIKKSRFQMASLEFHELQFNKKALELFNISEAMNDTWKINEKNEKFYLSKKKMISVESHQPPDDDEVYRDDPSVAVPKDRDDSFSIEYHVLFHPSYQVPVLYFNAYNLGESS